MREIYALIDRDLKDTGKRKAFKSPPPGPGDLADQKPYYVPVRKVKEDRSTGPRTVTLPTVVTVNHRAGVALSVQETTVIRDMTDAEKTARRQEIADSLDPDKGIMGALVDVVYEIARDVRAISDPTGPPLTREEFSAALVRKMGE